MIWQSNHRGVDFTVTPKGDDQWRWSFFTGAGPKFIISGDVRGSRQDAIAAGRNAIDAFLANRPAQEPPLAQLIIRPAIL